jgi:hypothetical protein
MEDLTIDLFLSAVEIMTGSETHSVVTQTAWNI